MLQSLLHLLQARCSCVPYGTYPKSGPNKPNTDDRQSAGFQCSCLKMLFLIGPSILSLACLTHSFSTSRSACPIMRGALRRGLWNNSMQQRHLLAQVAPITDKLEAKPTVTQEPSLLGIGKARVKGSKGDAAAMALGQEYLSEVSIEVGGPFLFCWKPCLKCRNHAQILSAGPGFGAAAVACVQGRAFGDQPASPRGRWNTDVITPMGTFYYSLNHSSRAFQPQHRHIIGVAAKVRLPAGRQCRLLQPFSHTPLGSTRQETEQQVHGQED